MYVYQHSDLEDRLDRLMLWMYQNNYPCTYVNRDILVNHQIFDDLDLSYDDEQACKEIYMVIYSTYRQFCREQNAISNASIKTLEAALQMPLYTPCVVDIAFHLDNPIRDYPFVIYNGVWLNYNGIGCYKSHKELLECELHVNVLSTNVRESGTIRPVLFKSLVFGNVVCNSCFIESYDNCTFEDAKRYTENKPFDKYFYFDVVHNIIMRWK